MRIIKEHKRRLEVFESLGEFAKLATQNSKPLASNKPEQNNWSKTENLVDACTLASNGWNEIRPEVDAVLVNLEDRLAEKFAALYVTEYATSGASVDMGRFVTGEPECMIEFAPTPKESMGRVVKIIVAGVASSGVDSEDIKRRGIAVLALVDTIHKMGVGIELWWESCIEGYTQGTHSTVVKLHDSSEPLDIDSVMFSLAHPSMLRRLVFSVQEQSETRKDQGVGSGYGSISDMQYSKIEEFDVVVEKLQNGYGDIVRNPFQWVISTVQGLGLGEE